jgi:nucleoside-diphosphate-sugar epimerase
MLAPSPPTAQPEDSDICNFVIGREAEICIWWTVLVAWRRLQQGQTELGWRPRIPLEAGIRQTYELYRASVVETR